MSSAPSAKAILKNGNEITIRPNGRRRVRRVFSLPSRTKQSFRDETDVNSIMKKYRSTGVVTHLNQMPPHYGDFSNVADYKDARNFILDAERAFESLPAAIRDRFQNDPAKFVEFTENPANQEEAIKLGLAKRREEPKGDETPPTPAPGPENPSAWRGNAPTHSKKGSKGDSAPKGDE